MNFESVHNYYEKLVFERILQLAKDKRIDIDPEHWEDTACIALNQLPPRYVRHDIDTAFYLSTAERLQMDDAVVKAVDYAIELMKRDKRNR